MSVESAVESAVDRDDLRIPLIDFSSFLSPSHDTKLLTATAILDGFRSAGFICLKNHPIAASTIAAVFEASAAFFARPQAEKEALAWTTPRANRGYVGLGREKVSQLKDKNAVRALRDAVPDLKESFEIGNETGDYPNRWPSPTNAGADGDGHANQDAEAVSFRRIMTAFYHECQQLNVLLMRAIAVGLAINETWFDDFIGKADNNLRLLHYPAVDKAVFDREDGMTQLRAGEHTDYGSITLLFQDSQGGLQVLSPRGNFIDATPIPDTIIVNAGDLLARWSNDTIKSTKHRVVQPPDLQISSTHTTSHMHLPRYSVAYFCNPDFDKIVDAVPGTWGGKLGRKKYEPVNCREYLEMRLSLTY